MIILDPRTGQPVNVPPPRPPKPKARFSLNASGLQLWAELKISAVQLG